MTDAPDAPREISVQGRVDAEYQPARVVKLGNPRIDRYDPPAVADKPIRDFDDHGTGLEPGNLAGINSLKLFRALRYGRNVELILTDNRSFRSEPVVDQATSRAFEPKEFPYVVSQDAIEMLDAGRTWNGGRPPQVIRFNGEDIPQSAQECSATVHAWWRTKGMVLKSVARLECDVEALGELGCYA